MMDTESGVPGATRSTSDLTGRQRDSLLVYMFISETASLQAAGLCTNLLYPEPNHILLNPSARRPFAPEHEE